MPVTLVRLADASSCRTQHHNACGVEIYNTRLDSIDRATQNVHTDERRARSRARSGAEEWTRRRPPPRARTAGHDATVVPEVHGHAGGVGDAGAARSRVIGKARRRDGGDATAVAVALLRTRRRWRRRRNGVDVVLVCDVWSVGGVEGARGGASRGAKG